MRTFLIVLDSVGIGHAPDAADYGDAGSDTLGHILAAAPDLQLPNMDSLGLASITGRPSPDSFDRSCATRLTERSCGKDTTTGHWELAGVVTTHPFATFEKFPSSLTDPIAREHDISFIGNEVASGTEIIDRLGADSVESGCPILYTSADSVFQIAAHRERFGLNRLYDLCRTARKIIDAQGLHIGRVIARPFTDASSDPDDTAFIRTAERHDWSLLPPPTVLNELVNADVPTIGVGKIADIFADQGITESHPTQSNADGMHQLDRLCDTAADRSFIFANLVDFDMLYGHRRDPQGYAKALAEFDQWLGTFLPRLRPDDGLLITADHGNDPTWTGTDHTREQVPLLTVNCPAPRHNGFTAVADILRDIYQLPTA